MLTLEQEYLINYGALLRIARMKFGYGNNWMFDAEDMLQQLYFQVAKIRDKVVEKPLSFLTVMLTRLVPKMRRHYTLIKTSSMEGDYSIEDNTEEMVEKETLTNLAVEGFATLKKRPAQAINYILKGYSVEYISVLLNTSQRAVRDAKYKALLTIKEYIRSKYVT